MSSMQSAVVFSLLLPLYIWAAAKLRRAALPAGVALILLTVGGGVVGSPALTYLPMFGVGTLMGVRREALGEWANRLAGRRWTALAVLAAVLVGADWLPMPVPGS